MKQTHQIIINITNDDDHESFDGDLQTNTYDLVSYIKPLITKIDDSNIINDVTILHGCVNCGLMVNIHQLNLVDNSCHHGWCGSCMFGVTCDECNDPMINPKTCDHSSSPIVNNGGCIAHNQLCTKCMIPLIDYHGDNACGSCIDLMHASPYVCDVDGCNNPSMYDDNTCDSCQQSSYAEQFTQQ